MLWFKRFIEDIDEAVAHCLTMLRLILVLEIMITGRLAIS
jgi:hypothetical protein